MSKSRRAVAVALFTLMFGLMTGILFGQFGRYFQPRYEDNQPPPSSEFVFARWQYSSPGGWWHDYPNAIDSLYVESPYDVGAKAEFYGINDSRGNLAVIICANNDIGDFWEWIDQPRYPLRPSAEGVRLGINFVLYSMTH